MAAAPAPPPPTCPACHASLTQPAAFCPACGAKLPAPPPPTAAVTAGPTPGAPPVDIRERVEQDRGTLKRLQLLIPGYRGYRQGEDARAADSFLRLQVADKVHRCVQVVQDCRQRMTAAGLFQGLMDLAPVLNDLQVLEGEIRQAE